METPIVVTVECTVNVPVAKAWDYWTNPAHIVNWNSASPDWHTPRAENDLRTGGSFSSRMEARDGSFGFDFGGVYDLVSEHKTIEYTLGDGRKVVITFTDNGAGTHILQKFDAEGTNPVEMQQAGWQAIMNSYKAYTESN